MKQIPEPENKPAEAQKIKALPGAPREIREKMARACQHIEREIARHPEYESHDLPTPQDTTGRNNRNNFRRHTAEVFASFIKQGKTMMVIPSGMEDYDYDYPEMTREGRQYLEKVAQDAAQAEKLRIGGRTRIFVSNHEKGWCSVGYTYTVQEKGAVQKAF